MSRYKDFDAAKSEAVGEPVTFTKGGEMFTLPASFPAAAMLDLLRIRADHGDGDMPESEIRTMTYSMLGAEQAQRLLALPMGIDELSEILTWIFSQYGAGGEPDAGNAPMPAAAGEKPSS